MSAGSVATWHDDSDVPKMELLNACYRNDIRKVADSLKCGVPVDATDDDLVTPLHIAAFTGNRELALLLLDSGADLEATSRTGMTAFLHACREGKMEVIDLLLQKGADIMKFTRMGASALTLAAAGGHLEVIKKLVGLRVPVSEARDTCPTPLITSVFRNFSPICVYLIGKWGQSVEIHSTAFLLLKWSMDNFKEVYESVSKVVDLTSRQLDTLLTSQRDCWSPNPREHSTETAYSHTLSNVTAASISPNKRRSLTPLGSIRNEHNRSRTSIRRADLFSRKSVTSSDMDRPTSGVETAHRISDRSTSRSQLPPLVIIQTTSQTRSPMSSRSELHTAVTPATAKSTPQDIKWSNPQSVKTARETSPSVSTGRQLTPKSKLNTAVEDISTRTAKMATPQNKEQTKSGKDMVVEKLADGRLKVSMTMDISAPGGRVGLAGQAPDGMKVKGAPPDIADNLLGLSALSCAVLLFNRSMLITLLDKGADPTKKLYMKKSAYELAQSLKRQDAVNLFYQRMTGRNSERKDVRLALMEDDFDKEELLQQRRLRLPSGCSPLHFSVAIGNINAVRCLAGDGMFLDEGEQKFGLSPLQTAALLGQTDVITFLLDKGASTQYLNQHKMTAFDYYIANGGEANENNRTALHCFRRRKSDLNLSGSSGGGTLRKVFPNMGTVGIISRKILGEKPAELPPVEARQWRETRMHTFPMQGRNYRKFVTVEDLLHQERTLFPKKSNNDDTVMDVVRSLATEATSFAVTSFYDWYSVGAERRVHKLERRPEPKEYDVAIANSLAYGYRRPQSHEQKTKKFPIYRVSTIFSNRETSPSSSGSYNSFRKIAAGYSETPSANQSRQTPRMLKKSKDTLEVEKHPEMRKSVSAGQLQPKGSPKATSTMMAHYGNSSNQIKYRFFQDLRGADRHDLVNLLEEAELVGDQLLKFTEQNFVEMGIKDPAGLRLLRDLQLSHSRVIPYHGSIH